LSLGGQPLDVFVASDDERAKQTVVQLVESMGLMPVDAGPLRPSRQLEGMGYLHMAVQEPLGTGFGSTIKIVSQRRARRPAVRRPGPLRSGGGRGRHLAGVIELEDRDRDVEVPANAVDQASLLPRAVVLAAQADQDVVGAELPNGVRECGHRRLVSDLRARRRLRCELLDLTQDGA
jgi:hypothetical protein